MNEWQKELVTLLARHGISENALISISILITTKEQVSTMNNRLLTAVENGKTLTDGLVGQILTDMMTEGLA